MSEYDVLILYVINMDNRLKEFLNRDNCYFIHYASDGFYAGNGSASKISCIMVMNPKKQIVRMYSLRDYIQDYSKSEAERLSLEDFKRLLDENPRFIHWNMTADGFGFKAIRVRANELGVELPDIPDENLFDLSSYVAYVAGKKLSIKQVLWFNSLLRGNDYLDGKTEAEYFDEGRYDEICNSIILKVNGFVKTVNLIKDDELRTEPPYQNNDGLTREERHQEAIKRSQMREQMLQEIMEHNRRVMGESEVVYEENEAVIFDPEHPVLSMFCNWFANWY